MHWILVILVMVGKPDNATPAITTIKFQNKEACEAGERDARINLSSREDSESREEKLSRFSMRTFCVHDGFISYGK